MSKNVRNLVAAGAILFLMAAVAITPRLWPDEGRTILSALHNQRIGEWRLYHATNRETAAPDEELLRRAQVHALSIADPVQRDRVQSLIHMARGRWSDAAAALTRISNNARNAETLNDLAVAMAVDAPENPINYFKARQLLEEARKLAPSAPAPLFNLLRVYRNIGLAHEAQPLLAEYSRVEGSRRWPAALTDVPDDARLVDALRKAIDRGNEQETDRLFRDNLVGYRRIATDYALNPDDHDGSDRVMVYIAIRIREEFQDESLVAMLSPLRGAERRAVVASRKLVREGIRAYTTYRIADSYDCYDKAESALQGVDSAFDTLWIELNRTDVDILTSQFNRARPALDRIVVDATGRNFPWLVGLAQGAKGSRIDLTQDYLAMENALAESIAVLNRIGASDSIARPLYYTATWRIMGGDVEGALGSILRCIRVARNDDHVRLSSIYFAMAFALHRLNFPSYALEFHQAQIRESEATANPQLIGGALMQLADMHIRNADYAEADRYVQRATDFIHGLDARQQVILGAGLDGLCGRLAIRRNAPDNATLCLERHIAYLKQLSKPVMGLLASAQALLAQAEVMRGDIPGARRLFAEAVRAIESDDNYLIKERSRLSFENERRELYKAAISFEYSHGGQKTAWSYLQRYRSKLFLEFLGETNPDVTRVHNEAVRHEAAEQMIPRNVQVMEYFVLDDLLLIWVGSRDRIEPVAVPVKAEALDRQIRDVVSKIRNREDVDHELKELYGLLIARAEGLLDPRKTIAIIPDRALHGLPFGALKDAASGKYFTEKFTFMESPNLTTLLASSGAPQRDSAVVYRSAVGGGAIGAEAPEVAGLYARASERSSNTDKGSFLSDLKDASIFHYAGHSVEAPDALRSAILLDGDRIGPNTVTAAEISHQRMRSNAVVVLASCDSSMGNFRDGVGLRGLTSALFVAGAGTVAGSLWRVEEYSTASLMRTFHEHFSRKISAAESMRKAQISFITENPEMAHPFYWSGFVVNGNLSALR